MNWQEYLKKRETVGLNEYEADDFTFLHMFRQGQEDMRLAILQTFSLSESIKKQIRELPLLDSLASWSPLG